MQDVVSVEVLKAELMPVLSRLLQDQEAEVRTRAIFQVEHVGVALSQADKEVIIITNVVPHLKGISEDANQHVRAALSTVLVSLTPVLGKAKTIEHISPLLMKLLKDDFADVRLNIISKLGDLQEVVGADQISRVILPEIISLAEDPQWRVRLAIVEQLPAFAKSLGAGPFDARMLTPAMGWLMDSVYAVRSAMVKQLGPIVQALGDAWAAKSLMPRLVAMSANVADRGYLARLTLLIAISQLTNSVSSDAVKSSLLPVALELAQHQVPNIRFNAARALGSIAEKMDAGVCKSQIRPALSKMVSDSDSDVQYYAKEALTKCH
jgi:serine/threonine-protein phosphatase 2A regulatory subunit A